MIDTIKFRIGPCDPYVIDKFLRVCKEFVGMDHENGQTIYQVYKSDVNLGSWDYHVNFMVDDPNIFIEFSLPKFEYGNNLYLYPVEKLSDTLQKLHKSAQSHFKVRIPEPLFWEVVRLDLCYAWRFYNDDIAQKVVEYMKTQQYVRKSKITYKTSVMFKGADYSLKFYAKGPEFYKHDYLKYKKVDQVQADELLSLARGIVRFEVTLRHDAIKQRFKVPEGSLNIMPLLTSANIIYILRGMLNDLLGVSPSTMSTKEVFAKFLSFATKIKSNGKKQTNQQQAVRLYSFYKLFLSPDPVDSLAISRMADSTRRRYKRILRDMEVGIPDDLTGTDVSIEIPSEFSVGEFSPM